LAVHFECVRQHIDQLAAQGVIERRAVDGLFDMDQSRLRYLTHLRSEHRRSPRTAADAEHVKVKTEILQLKLAENRRDLVRQSDVDALIDDLGGVVLTALHSMPARCARRGLGVRRCIEQVEFDVRTEIARIAQQKADEAGEPPL
jgi:phage terminase Nu1 subunit (DNA packaging protein)